MRRTSVRNSAISALLAPLQLRVAGVQISDRASWSLTTVPRVQVELGRDESARRLQQRLGTIVAPTRSVMARLDGPATRVDAR